ncbi:G protein pathway suppressor 2-like isoform X3 [Pseudorasbora parva]|uniref:G protein pathway suppressor 2-like isoform X3 n=1 Tax=Pseudorasbora parva TaxID=51549 RepID=UPI00351F6EA5
MPALLERPKLSNAMARALHKHIMKERERKRQEEEEVDKMMEQKMKEEEERKRTKEMEERMSLEETKEQVQKMGEKLQVLQEEKHQLFLQLKKVLHEEERRRRKEQSYQSSLPLHSGQHLLSIQGSPVSHNRAGALLGERSKQLFQTPLMPGHQFSSQPGFLPGSSEHGQFSSSAAVHEPFAVTQSQHHTSYGHAASVPISFASTTQIRGASVYVGPSPFQSMPFLTHQPQGYAVHSHFTAQPGFIPSASIPLQKQLEHANQQSGFTDSAALRPMHSQALHVSAAGLMSTSSMAVQIPTAKSQFQSSSQPASRHAFVPHTQAGQRFFHHGKPH